MWSSLSTKARKLARACLPASDGKPGCVRKIFDPDYPIPIIRGAMVPKIETCLDAIQGATEAAQILDGRIAHVLLLEIFTEHGVGTMIADDRFGRVG